MTISKQEFKKVTNNIFGKRLFDGRGNRLKLLEAG